MKEERKKDHNTGEQPKKERTFVSNIYYQREATVCRRYGRKETRPNLKSVSGNVNRLRRSKV
jgi:hypothetical protein